MLPQLASFGLPRPDAGRCLSTRAAATDLAEAGNASTARAPTDLSTVVERHFARLLAKDDSNRVGLGQGAGSRMVFKRGCSHGGRVGLAREPEGLAVGASVRLF